MIMWMMMMMMMMNKRCEKENKKETPELGSLGPLGHNLCSRRIRLLIQFYADDQKAQLSEQRAAPEGPFSEF